MLQRLSATGFLLLSLGSFSPLALAQDPMVACANKFDELDAAQQVPDGMDKMSFVTECLAQATSKPKAPRVAPAPPATKAAPDPTAAEPASTPAAKPPADALTSTGADGSTKGKPDIKSRMKACATQYDAEKAAGSWATFWPACVAKLKDAGQ